MGVEVAVSLFAGLTAASAVYSLGVVWAVWRYRAQPPATPPPELPPVSILKPLCGRDPELYENLLSHARQDYPAFEIVCGAADAEDPARQDVERLAHEFPDRDISFSVAGAEAEGNPKVAILEELAERAHHDVFVVNDSDIRVGPGYIRTLVSELESRDVGLVTCLYRAQAAGGAASWADALWITTEFPGQALLSRTLQGVRFGLGATLALRRLDVGTIGGFAAIRLYLADDYQIGARIAESGRKVRISEQTVETVLGAVSWRDLWRRHLRWSRTIRASRPAGHLGLAVTFGGVWAGALAALDPSWAAWAAACCAARVTAAAATAGFAVRSRLWRRAWLAPAFDYWNLFVWLASFAARRVRWRGRNLQLDRAGRIVDHGS